MLNIGLIGPGKQAKKIIYYMQNECKSLKIYNHCADKKLSLDKLKNSIDMDKVIVCDKIEDLVETDCVIISSPNSTHVNYLKNLIELNFKGFILCEKPIATNINELEYLEKIPAKFKEKIYVNLNYRFTKYFELLNSTFEEIYLGRLQYVDIVNTHGLALKKDYNLSWRSESCNGIVDNLLVHFVDLLMYKFDLPEEQSIFAMIASNYSASYDNACFQIKFSNGPICNIFVSYTVPKMKRFTYIFENAIVEFNNNELTVRYPRETFNDNGIFVLPPVVKHFIYTDEREILDASLKFSIDNFLFYVKMNKNIDEHFFNTALDSIRLVLTQSIFKIKD